MWIIGIEGILNNPKMFTEKTIGEQNFLIKYFPNIELNTVNTYKVKSREGLIQIFDRGRYLFMKLYPDYAEMVH
jgi:hypothetical protein